MKKRAERRVWRDELRSRCNLSRLKGGDRGKYVERYPAGTNLVLLSPDVAEHFSDVPSVNKALRRLVGAARERPAAHVGYGLQIKKRLSQKPHPLKNENPKAAPPAED